MYNLFWKYYEKEIKFMKHTFVRMLSLVLVLSMLVGMFATGVMAAPAQTDAAVYDLRVDDLTAPVGLDNPTPTFSWKMDSNAVGAAQTAYHIVVTDGDVTMWDSGWQESGLSTGINYAGKALESSTEYTVKVAIKDENGNATDYAVSTFEMALLEEDAFADAKWISYQPSSTMISDTTTYTIDFDFIIDTATQGFCFGMKDTGTFIMWQVNAFDKKNQDKILLRPHFKSGGSWTAYPGLSGSNVQEVNLNDAIGYTPDTVIGKTVHERIEVNGTNVKTWFGPNAENLTLAYDYTHTSALPLYNVGFRHYSNDQDGTEITRYDNIVIKDGNGQVLYNEDFEDGKVNMTTSTTNYSAIENGMLKVGTTSLINEHIYLLNNGSNNLHASSLPAFRKTIDVKDGLVSAKLYTSGLGVYESFVNGQRVGRLMDDETVAYDELKPGFTLAKARMLYNTYDITWMLNKGENILSSIVTSGWWTGNASQIKQGNTDAYLAKLILTYEDGTQEVIVTDSSWKTAKAAPVLTGTGIYQGERFDARISTDWMLPGYDDSAWGPSKINTEFKGKLTAWRGQTVTVREDLERSPVEMYIYEGATGASSGYYGTVNKVSEHTDGEAITLKPGQTLLVNFGQNFAGWESLTLDAQAGTTIYVDHAEWLNDGNGATSRGCDGPEGSIYTANYRGATSDTYYYTVEGTQTYRPMYSFYGFQYMEITTDKEVTFTDISGQVVTSVAEDTASISTSNADVNQLISNVRWGMYSNYLSVATDCPQRNERQGWTGDTQVFAETGLFLGHNKSFLEKMMWDIVDSQITDPNNAKYGAYTEIAPKTRTYFADGDGGTGWADAGIIVPYNLYIMSGDTSVIREYWDSMVLYMDQFLAKREYGPTTQFSDWLCYEAQTADSKNILSVAYYAWDAMLMSEMAEAIGDTASAEKYQAVYNERKEFFIEKFVNEDGSLVSGLQASCLYALYIDLLPNEESVQKVTEQLISNIERNGNKLQTGFLGTAILMNTLTKVGRSDVAYKLLLQDQNPSWLYSVDQGATTTWERWNTYTLATGFGDVGMNSFNHYAYGAVSGWMYSDMAGIDYDPAVPGFKHIILEPNPDQSIPVVEASYDSAYGTIVSNMAYESGAWNYDCVIPANTTASIKLPVEKIGTLTVNGKTDLTAVEGLTYVGYENGYASFEAVAGSYSFTSSITKEYTVELAVNAADATMPPVEAEIIVDGESRSTSLPTTLSLKDGSEVVIKAVPSNPVDYAVTGWSDGTEGGEKTFTVTGETTLTVNTAWVGHNNLAKGKSVTADQVNEDWAAAHLTDGYLNHLGGPNGWSSPSQGKSNPFTEQTAVIDLGAEMVMDRFHLYPRTYAPANVNFPTSYTISVSSNNTDWSTVYATTDGEVTNGYKPAVIELENAVYGRYVKLGVTGVNQSDENGSHYVQLSEFGVYNVNHQDASMDKHQANTAIQGLSGYQYVGGISDANAVQTAIDTAKAAVEAYVQKGGAVEDLTNYEYIAGAEAALAQWNARQIHVYTIDFDFVIKEGSQSVIFSVADHRNLVMWQVNAFRNKTGTKVVQLRPHTRTNGTWACLANIDLTDFAYDTDTILNQPLHERLEINGREVKTYLGTDADNLVLVSTYTMNRDIPLRNFGFRTSTDKANGAERADFDNMVVRDGEGNVLFSEDFSNPETVVITGTSSYYTVADGKLSAGSTEELTHQLFILNQKAVEADPDQEAADKVIALIDAIGPVVGNEKFEQIKAAHDAYQQLTPAQKALVTNYDVLQAAINVNDAAALDQLIDAIGEVTLDSKNDIEVARSVYNQMPGDIQALVTKLAVLEAAEARYAELVAAAEQEAADKAAAAEVDAKIAAIGEVTLNSKAAIDEARAAYDNATDAVKALVTKLDVLTAAEAAYEALLNPGIKDVTIELTAKETVNTYDGDMVYTVSAKDMVDLATVILTIDLDETLLTDPVATAGEGWELLAQTWKNGILNVAIANFAGADGEGVLVTVTATPNGSEGEATAAVTEASLTAYEGEGETWVNVKLDNASVTTVIKAYSIFDVNRDGVVDQLDMTRAQRYFGLKAGDEGWYEYADVNTDDTVDINDLILILANFHEMFE